MKKRNKLIVLLILILFPITTILSSCSDGCNHQFSNWTVVKDAGCETAGLKTKTCSLCGHTIESVIKAKGHNYGPNDTCTICGDDK